MSFAIWMLLVASTMPYVCVGIARRGLPGPYDNNMPRKAIEHLTGWRQRLEWAHRNNFENFPPFAAAVIIAIVTQVPSGWVNGLAAAFVVARILHNLAYAFDKAALRSALWTVGYACVAGLFVAAATR